MLSRRRPRTGAWFVAVAAAAVVGIAGPSSVGAGPENLPDPTWMETMLVAAGVPPGNLGPQIDELPVTNYTTGEQTPVTVGDPVMLFARAFLVDFGDGVPTELSFSTPNLEFIDDLAVGDPNWLGSQPGGQLVVWVTADTLDAGDAAITETSAQYVVPGQEQLVDNPLFPYDPLRSFTSNLSIAALSGQDELMLSHAIVSDGAFGPTTNPLWVGKGRLAGGGILWATLLPASATDIQVGVARSADGTAEDLAGSSAVPSAADGVIRLDPSAGQTASAAASLGEAFADEPSSSDSDGIDAQDADDGAPVDEGASAPVGESSGDDEAASEQQAEAGDDIPAGAEVEAPDEPAVAEPKPADAVDSDAAVEPDPPIETSGGDDGVGQDTVSADVTPPDGTVDEDGESLLWLWLLLGGTAVGAAVAALVWRNLSGRENPMIVPGGRYVFRLELPVVVGNLLYLNVATSEGEAMVRFHRVRSQRERVEYVSEPVVSERQPARASEAPEYLPRGEQKLPAGKPGSARVATDLSWLANHVGLKDAAEFASPTLVVEAWDDDRHGAERRVGQQAEAAFLAEVLDKTVQRPDGFGWVEVTYRDVLQATEAFDVARAMVPLGVFGLARLGLSESLDEMVRDATHLDRLRSARELDAPSGIVINTLDPAQWEYKDTYDRLVERGDITVPDGRAIPEDQAPVMGSVPDDPIVS